MPDLMKVAENIRKNNMEAHVAETRANALKIIKTLLPKGATVGSGGSVTLDECGVIDLLKCGDYLFHERVAGLTPEQTAEIFRLQHGAEYYFSGCNAITEAGELYNVDGTANRISAISHGPQKVILVAGKNKIVNNIVGAVERIKTVAAPKNCARLGYQTPCLKTGHCVSIDQKRPFATDGCQSPDRICCHYLITGFQKRKNRITVILINEDLGL